MTTQLDTEDWKAFRRELQEFKATKRDANTTLISKFCMAYGVTCQKLTPYHFRLSREGYNTVDVFPTSGKVHPYKGTFQKTNIIKFLTKHFSG